MSQSNILQENAKQYAIKAVDLDRNGQFESAIFYYMEASQSLIDYKLLDEANFTPTLQGRLNDYISRAEKLKQQVAIKKLQQSQSNPNLKSQNKKEIERALCMVREALDEDSDGKFQDAFELYTNAAEIYISLSNQKNIEPENEALFKKLQLYVQQALKRAEEIKLILKKQNTDDNIKLGNVDDQSIENELNNLKVFSSSDEESNESPPTEISHISQPMTTILSRPFTSDEIAVLRRGSSINSRNYVPFFSHLDSKEKFFFTIPFSDKDGKLALSQSQRQRFSHWARPDECFESPTLMMLVSSMSVKQTCISDCSFVASLTVCAQYERKFGKSLLSKIIYPQNKKGEPIFNPCGKYMISLTLNGCERKITVDDYFPVDSHNQFLCSHTTNRGELWVSLLEKAYLKVMGGYDFPGSNSNIDLHALTNWIPERISIKGMHNSFDKEKDFQRMFERLHSGDVLITLATGPLSKSDEDRTGLVPTHAYAVLDIRMFNGVKLFQIKNPWSHLRWKGNYSEYDVKNWTEDLQTALNYNPKLACNIDNGVFWIDYESLIMFFDVFYLSWNPNLFQYTSLFHRKWSSNEGPIKDRYNLGENPQYILKTKCKSSARCTTWLLLTRHIVDKQDFADNKEYIALVVYKNNGKRIYYPSEPEPYKEGIRINSPHYLVKLVDDEPGPVFYTLVISQYEKYNSIYYTLRTFSTQSFQLDEIKEPYVSKYSKRVTGKWTKATAGGCSNYQESYMRNPVYQITLSNSSANNCLKIELKGPQQYSVGFDIVCVGSNVTNNPKDFKQTSSGSFRKGFSVLPLNELSGGTYTIRPSTYLPGQEGPFILEISSSREFQINQVQ